MTRLFANQPTEPRWIKDEAIKTCVFPLSSATINTQNCQKRIDPSKIEEALLNMITSENIFSSLIYEE